MIKLNGILVPVLLDSGAHVSVLPKSLIEELTNLPQDFDTKRPIRAFGGHEIQLLGPVELLVDICSVKLKHPFYFVDSDVPAIAGYDILKAARIVLDPHQHIVWSNHPDVLQRQARDAPLQCDPSPSVQEQARDAALYTDRSDVLQRPARDAPLFVDHLDAMQQLARDAPLQGNNNKGSESTQDTTATVNVNSNADEQVETLNVSAPCFTPKDYLLSRPTVADNADGAVNVDVDVSDVDDQLPDHLLLLYETTVSNTKITSTVDKQFRDLLKQHAGTFAKNSTDLGFCSTVEHDIDTGDTPPVKQPPRRPPLSAGDAENQIIDDMLASGVIEPSTSPWASPVCLVKKPDGTYRFCVDYRRVNDISRKDAYPVPDIQDALDSLRGSQYFCTLDLLSGYWQLGLTERAKERSAFCTRRGLFQFKRMPFGLCGAPATFCRLMTTVLGDLLWSICLCYIDDLIIFARSQQELLERLDTILTRLSKFGLKVKPNKCVLFRQEIPFLGHLVTPHGVMPLPDKVKVIKEWPTPRCIRDVRAFYGLVGYYRRFIAGFAKIAEPLTNLTKKNVKFVWSDEVANAFDKLKQAMLEVPTLAFPYPDVPVIVDTDSSDVAYGCVISQVVNGQERPIAFFSRIMSQSQRNYCATRRELLAVIAVTTLQALSPERTRSAQNGPS